MAKKQPVPSPFSEEDTPISSPRPKNVTKARKPEPLVLPVEDDSLVAQSREVAKLKAEARAEKVIEQVEEVEEDVRVTANDLARLHAMFAEISFDRSRDGSRFQVALKGSRGQTGGKINKFETFASLIAHVRSRS